MALVVDDSHDMWLATQINPMALTGLATHLLPGGNKATLKMLTTLLGEKTADISVALRTVRSGDELDVKSQSANSLLTLVRDAQNGKRMTMFKRFLTMFKGLRF